MFKQLFFLVFFPIVGTSSACIILWILKKYKYAFVMAVFNTVGYAYLSVVILVLGNPTLIVFKIMMICFGLASLVCAIHLGIKMKKQVSDYAEINSQSPLIYVRTWSEEE